jgi:hypothetical protein
MRDDGLDDSCVSAHIGSGVIIMNYDYLSNYGKAPESEASASSSDDAGRKRPWRTIIGVLVALLALGAVLWFFLFGPTPLELKARKYALPDRQFADQNMRLNLPPGWMMLKRDNPFFHNVVSGQMFAIHPRSGCTAVLFIWPNTGSAADFMLDNVKDRFVGWERISERDRQSVTLAGQEARRATYDLWRQKAIREVAYVTTLKDDLRQYLLLGYAPLEGGDPALSAFKELEKGLQLDPLPASGQVQTAQ